MADTEKLLLLFPLISNSSCIEMWYPWQLAAPVFRSAYGKTFPKSNFHASMLLCDRLATIDVHANTSLCVRSTGWAYLNVAHSGPGLVTEHVNSRAGLLCPGVYLSSLGKQWGSTRSRGPAGPGYRRAPSPSLHSGTGWAYTAGPASQTTAGE